MYDKASGCIPVTEVEEAAVVVRVLVLKAQVGPAAQTVVSYTQLLGHRGLSGFPTWKATERWKEGASKMMLIEHLQIHNDSYLNVLSKVHVDLVVVT